MERENRTVPVGSGLNSVMMSVHILVIVICLFLVKGAVYDFNWRNGMWFVITFGVWIFLALPNVLDIDPRTREFIMRFRNNALVAVHIKGFVFLFPFLESAMRVKNPLRKFDGSVRVNVIGENDHTNVAARGAEVTLPYTVFGFLRPEYAASILEIGVNEQSGADTSQIDEQELRGVVLPLTDAMVRSFASGLTLDDLNTRKGYKIPANAVVGDDASTVMPDGFEITHILFGDPQESAVVIAARDEAQAELARREAQQTRNMINSEKLEAIRKDVAKMLRANPTLDANLVYATIARTHNVDVEELKRYDINVTGLSSLSHVEIGAEALRNNPSNKRS